MLCEASGPWDPNVGADTALFMLGGFLFKHIFPFSVFLFAFSSCKQMFT